MSQQPKLNTPDLLSLIIGEILLVRDSLDDLPNAGPGVRISDDCFLLKSTQRLHKRVQGEWREVDHLPLADYLTLLRKSIANRTHLVKTRIRKLSDTLKDLESIFEACDDIPKLESILRQHSQRRQSRNSSRD